MDSMIFKASRIEDSLSSKQKLNHLTRMTASLDQLQRDVSVVNLSNSILASIDLSKSGIDLRERESPQQALNIIRTPRQRDGMKLP
jgi:hypothetical protein